MSIAGAIGLFLWFISLVEAKPHHLKGLLGDVTSLHDIMDITDVQVEGKAIPF